MRWARSALLSVLAVFSMASLLPAQSPPTASCSDPEFHQFDFWVGDWDTFAFANPTLKTAHVRVDRILDGCVLRETYEGANGLHGQSFSLFDVTRKVWHQTWVTNRGQLLTIEGALQGSEMILAGADRTLQGHERLVRGTWKPVDGGVREIAVTSTDGGRTWVPWFDLLFRPHVSGPPDRAPHKSP
jgi:hypothetical protein